MRNGCKELVQERRPVINAATCSDRPIVKGCEQLHLMQLATLYADKPHYVKLTTPFSSDESCGTRSALACRVGSIWPKRLDTNGLRQVHEIRAPPVPVRLPRHASTKLRFTMDLPVPMW